MVEKGNPHRSMKSVLFSLYFGSKATYIGDGVKLKMSFDDYLIERNSSSQQEKPVGNSIPSSFFFLSLCTAEI